MVDFDIRTCDAAYRFILEFMDMTSEEYITELVIECENDFERFWERNIDRITEVDISDLRIMAFHILGAVDECKEIKSAGLMNLQKVLSESTNLSRLLSKVGIVFNIIEKTVSFNGKNYDIDYDNYRYKHFLSESEVRLSDVARRVFYDYCANGFLMNDNVFDYGTDIHERPEFLMILAELFPQVKKLEYFWKEQSKSYRIDFFVTLDQVQRFSFELDEYKYPPYEGWNKLDDDLKLKKWMLSHAIDRAVDNLVSDKVLCVKNDVIIPPSQFLKITEYKNLL